LTIEREGLERLSSAFSTHGLILRGGFNFSDSDERPPGSAGKQARSVLLVGNAGAGYWPHFRRWRQAQPPGLAHPLDTWCREIIGAAAREVGARAVSPSDRPYLPFQQWAMRAEGLKPSPLGILMHPEYGPWHAYRGALLFDEKLPVAEAENPIHLCDACAGKPCMKACPVDAYSLDGFAYEDCLAHVRGPTGEPCRTRGCLDRNACPYGADYRYPAEVQAFHMAAFARL
jgi:hypothetical protein